MKTRRHWQRQLLQVLLLSVQLFSSPGSATSVKTLGWSPAYLIRTGGFVPKLKALVSATSVLMQASHLHQWLCMRAQSLSCLWLFVTPWTVACQAPLSVEFSRQEYWRGLPFPILGDLSCPGIKLASPVSPALASGFFTIEPPRKPHQWLHIVFNVLPL